MADASLEEIFAEYHKLAHAMQSGVAFEHGRGGDDGTVKHLRVGVNVALSDMGGLVKLLVDKGVITEMEYAVAIRDAMRAKVERYEQRAARVLGREVTFG